MSETGKVDQALLERFRREIKNLAPHRQGGLIINSTPLIDITDALVECARVEYGLDISGNDTRVFGKFESQIRGGSVKVRPAIEILDEAIASGRLRSGQTVFEATSGNFGVALGMLENLGLRVVALVSRKLQDGVLEELRHTGVKLVDLDVDICPAPGTMVDTNTLVARAVASNVRERLAEIGLDVAAYDDSRVQIEALLARQDIINLAKLLAMIYGGFCPEQYDNRLNASAHETITGPEIDQQLHALGHSLANFRVVCTFGTGGTSAGLGDYGQLKYDKRLAHVVFPLGGQDVAGIRTKEKATGLRFYRPESYSGQHEVDSETSKRLLRFFVSKGYDIGESSALALYAVVQMVNYGAGNRFVVILADGIGKYRRSVEIKPESRSSPEVTAKEASSNPADYVAVLWTHPMFTPKEEGIKLIASSLRCAEDKVSVVSTSEVERILATREVPEIFSRLLPDGGRKLLLVCMAGGTSLRVAQILAEKGMNAESLSGGITSLSTLTGKQPHELVQLARK